MSTLNKLPPSLSQHIIITPEIQHALQHNLPIVALESTIISHGMPYPQNLQTAIQVENECRKQGAIPATIAILNGKIHIGLTEPQLETLAKLGTKCYKVSRRDLSYVISHCENGATTVSATMLIAHTVGIKIFATGGIGGVHRGVEQTLDISADLTELGKTPVTVICAGIKSILDIPRTLEYLETEGVTVCSYGTQEFPAFFTRKSGCQSPHTVHTEQEIAKLIQTQTQLQIQTGIVIAIPIPTEEEAAASVTDKATQQALQELTEKKISGKNATPFLLQRINELTSGESLKSNILLRFV